MEDWYDNKQLYEMLQTVKQDISEMRKEMAETRTLIRDYNGLREKIDDSGKRISKVESSLGTIKWLIPILIAGMGLFLTYSK
jgi:DNA repair exonuclease SbcCD ATPase subunit